ncbi:MULTISPECIES: cation:proton antiporter [unclassified Rhodococcus (in: high G+C Gram-positive bacteria)]|uniref:cation:proton antiporter n=1 Tax=unclassified Rhodococcus (in: high G+C Gram-positive bacteria) TaxID=192944 RepID=UPI00163AE6CA|nr:MULTISPECIES: cation:proton antiporter [unclassified Rhodococcus (in: high G+C Gram-positive bacteria)]MBC2640179.1 cation:proton antiporter [Rhodococcus sp. 3A]MBC2895074.1 cation:proton antiporter [Rhodococcus sp. 4CII]
MSFETLALISAAALAGPLLALRREWHLPVMLGELLVGILLGTTGIRVIHPEDPTFTFLADIGFALIMFVAGTHVPVRDATIRPALAKGAARAAIVGVLAAATGFGIARAFGTGHAALYAVLIASSSAALVLPLIDSLRLEGTPVVQTMAQVAVADTACIIALPLVINPAQAPRAAIGAVAVAASAALFYAFLKYADGRGWLLSLHQESKDRRFALELRINLSVLFALAALAVHTHVSIMLAGFALGLAVAGVGEPRRLAKQLFSITEGFLGPLFFVWLGASLNLRDLRAHPSLILLGVALGLAAVAVHCAIRLLGQPLALAALASAQLGVPVAAATIGEQSHILQPGEPSALILGALVTIGSTTFAGAMAARQGFAAPSAAGPVDGPDHR